MSVVNLFLRGAINELHPMRILSRKALSVILKIYKPNLHQDSVRPINYADYRSSVSEAQEPLDEMQWRSTAFVDNSMIFRTYGETVAFLSSISSYQTGKAGSTTEGTSRAAKLMSLHLVVAPPSFTARS